MKFQFKYLIVLLAMFNVVRASDVALDYDEEIDECPGARRVNNENMDQIKDEARDPQKLMVSQFYNALARDVSSKLSTGLFYLGTAFVAGSAIDYVHTNADLLTDVFSMGVGVVLSSLIAADYVISATSITEHAKLMIPAGILCFGFRYLIDTKVLEYLGESDSEGNEKKEE